MENVRNSESVNKTTESQRAAENFFFLFQVISEEEVKNGIKNLFIYCSGDIPTKILKQHAQIYSKKSTWILNESIKMGKFHDILRKAEVSPVYKKDSMNNKQTYRPMSTLSNISDVFRKLIYSQINTCMSDKFSKYVSGFLKNHDRQHELLNTVENWQNN